MQFLKQLFFTVRFWLIVVLLTLVFAPLSIMARGIDSSGDWSHKCNSWWSRWTCILNGVKVTVEGMEHVDLNRAQIFVANHQSYFDIFALDGFLPVQLRWMSKASIFNIPLVGWAMRAADCISVERGDKKKSYQAFLASVEKLKSGKSVVIFPEGTRSETGEIGEFKKGGHLLSARSKVPLTPATIIGSREIIKKGSGTIHPRPVKIIISPPIEWDPKKSNKGENVLEEIRQIICRNFEENSS